MVSARPIPVATGSGADVRAGNPSVPWIVLAAIGAIGLAALTAALMAGVVFPFDRPILDFAKAWGGPRITWEAVSQSANIPPIVLGVGFVALQLWHRRYREAILTILGMITLRYWRTTSHRRLALLLLVLVVVELVLVGIARVALLEHYPTDLLGGLFGGIAALGVYGWFSRPGGWADRPPLPARAA